MIMKVTIVQNNIEWQRKAENMQRIERLIRECAATDVIVLPEMFATGFCTVPEEIAEPSENGEVLAWMKRMASEKNAAMVGSVAVADGGKYYNRMYFVKPDGDVEYYDKRHLFSYGKEDRYFTAGADRVVVNFRGARILLQVCYDLRFPVWSRNTGDYDIAVYIASWPVGRIAVWNLLLRARAVENQCYVVGVNRVGADPECVYSGNSAVIHPYGKPVAECTVDMEDCRTADLDLDWLDGFRKKFPVIQDADKFTVTN